MNIMPYLMKKSLAHTVIKSIFGEEYHFDYDKIDALDEELLAMLEDEAEITDLELSEIDIDLTGRDLAAMEITCVSEEEETNYIFYFDKYGNYIEYEVDG